MPLLAGQRPSAKGLKSTLGRYSDRSEAVVQPMRRARSRKLGTFARQIENPSANTPDATARGPRTDSAKLAMPTVTPNADR